MKKKLSGLDIEKFEKFWKKNPIFFIIQNEFVSSKMNNIPCFDTFPKNNFYKNYLKGQAMTLLQEGGQPYNPCGFVSDNIIGYNHVKRMKTVLL